MPFKRLDVANRWKVLGGADGAGATGRAMKIKSFPRNKLMAYVTGTPDGGPSEVGVLRLSSDYGLSWADAATPAGCDGCLDVDEAPNGDLWGLFYDSTDPGNPDGYTAKVAVSLDSGTSWTVKYTHTPGFQAFNIAISPKRGIQQIAFTCRDAQGSPGSNGTRYIVVVSTDSGATWLYKPIAASAESPVDVPLIVWVHNNLVVYTPGEETPGSAFFGVGGGTSVQTEWEGGQPQGAPESGTLILAFLSAYDDDTEDPADPAPSGYSFTLIHQSSVLIVTDESFIDHRFRLKVYTAPYSGWPLSFTMNQEVGTICFTSFFVTDSTTLTSTDAEGSSPLSLALGPGAQVLVLGGVNPGGAALISVNGFQFNPFQGSSAGPLWEFDIIKTLNDGDNGVSWDAPDFGSSIGAICAIRAG